MKPICHTSSLSRRAGLLATAMLLALPAAHAARDLATLDGVEKKVQAVPVQTRASVIALQHAMNGGLAGGSGTVVSADGLILTAAHVVDETDTVDVVFQDGIKTQAKVLGCDFDHDLALVKITAPGKYSFVELGDSDKLKVGDDVAALGHSGGFDPKRPAPVRYGRIFHVDAGILLRSDCILVGGDSGGPLFDLDGRLIGVHSSVGEDPSINNDVPVNIAKAGWDRMLKGERWGVNKESATDLTIDELAGLSIRKFRRTLTEETMKGVNSTTDPENLKKWLLADGMDKERVAAMSDDDLKLFAHRCLKIGGKSGKSDLPNISKDELAGLDLARFRQQVMDAAVKNNGKLQATPEQIAGWLRAAGMQEEKVKAMSPVDLSAFVGKALGNSAQVKAEAGAVPAPKGDVALPEGLDLAKLRALVMEDAVRNQGKVSATPEAIAGWLQKAGVDEAKAKSLDPGALIALLGKAMGSAAKVQTQQVPQGGAGKAAAANPTDLEGVDMAKFKKRILEEAMKNQGRLALDPETTRGWLRDCGLSEEKAKALTPEGINAAVQAALGKGAVYNETKPSTLSPEQKIIAELDQDVLAALHPATAKIAPSVVTFTDGEKKLAMGTIVRSNGYILTKRSEIARAGEGKLKAKLADGRTFAATEVSTFADHDLALVRIDADSLPAVDLTGTDATPVPGSFLFTPGTNANGPMLGIGVLSVADRSLKETGGFLGVMMKDTPEGVEVREAVADGPAAKAGLLPMDRITSVNGTPYKTALELGSFIRTFKPKDKLQVVYQRAGGEHTVEIVLAERPRAKKDKNAKSMTSVGTEVSEVSDGYPLVFQHDQQLKPEDCGSPIIDLHGNVVGVNIARVGRVDSYAIPAKTVTELLGTVNFAPLEKAPAPESK